MWVWAANGPLAISLAALDADRYSRRRRRAIRTGTAEALIREHDGPNCSVAANQAFRDGNSHVATAHSDAVAGWWLSCAWSPTSPVGIGAFTHEGDSRRAARSSSRDCQAHRASSDVVARAVSAGNGDVRVHVKDWADDVVAPSASVTLTENCQNLAGAVNVPANDRPFNDTPAGTNPGPRL